MVMMSNFRAWNAAALCGGPILEALDLAEEGHRTSQTEYKCDKGCGDGSSHISVLWFFLRLLVEVTDILKNYL